MWANEMGNGIPGPKMFLSRRDISSGKDIGTKSEGSSGEGLSFARMVEMDNYMILFSTPSSLPESRGQVTAEVYDKTGAFTKELKLGSPPRRTFRTASSNVWMDGRKGHLRSGADAFMLAGIEGDLHCQYVWCVQPTEKDMHCTITLQTCVNGKEEHDDALYVAAASNLPGMKPTYAIHKFRLQHLERPIVKPQNHAGNTYLP
jgi:hypothetical protein